MLMNKDASLYMEEQQCMFVMPKFQVNSYLSDVEIDGEKYHLFHL